LCGKRRGHGGRQKRTREPRCDRRFLHSAIIPSQGAIDFGR
jgi:hypothetical protein